MANPRRQAQIAAAATELFDTLGYHGTGMGDIAKACGMGTSSLYNHFAAKQDVLAESIMTTMQSLLNAHAMALAGLTSPVDRLRQSMITHVAFHAENAQSTRVVNQEFPSLQDPARSVVRQLRRDYVARWTDIIQSGVDEGSFQVPDVKLTCYALLDMGIAVELWFRNNSAYDAQQLGEKYADMAMRLVREQPR